VGPLPFINYFETFVKKEKRVLMEAESNPLCQPSESITLCECMLAELQADSWKSTLLVQKNVLCKHEESNTTKDVQ
jgi:hypothetical protein